MYRSYCYCISCLENNPKTVLRNDGRGLAQLSVRHPLRRHGGRIYGSQPGLAGVAVCRQEAEEFSLDGAV